MTLKLQKTPYVPDNKINNHAHFRNKSHIKYQCNVSTIMKRAFLNTRKYILFYKIVFQLLYCPTQLGIKPESCLNPNAEGVDEKCRSIQHAFFECRRSLVRYILVTSAADITVQVNVSFFCQPFGCFGVNCCF